MKGVFLKSRMSELCQNLKRDQISRLELSKLLGSGRHTSCLQLDKPTTAHSSGEHETFRTRRFYPPACGSAIRYTASQPEMASNKACAHLDLDSSVFSAPFETLAAAQLLPDTLHLPPVGRDNTYPNHAGPFFAPPIASCSSAAAAVAGAFDSATATQTRRHELGQKRGDEGCFTWVLVRASHPPLGAGRYIHNEKRRKARP